MNWTLQTIPISKLQEWEGNPRKISPEDLEHLKQSFLDFGHARTLTVSPEEGKYVIIGGNQSKKALKELGIKEIQCSVSDRPLTENEKRTLSIRLNHRNKGEGEWDVEILNTWDDIDLEFEGLDGKNEKTENNPYEKPEIEFSEELLLEHNYVVLYFDNTFDWQVAQEKLNLSDVKSCIKTEKSQKVGIGRVINGADVINRL